MVSCMELERARARPVWRSGRISSSSSKLSIYFSLGTTHEALLGGVDVGLGVSATDSVSVEQVRAFRRGAAQPVQDVSAAWARPDRPGSDAECPRKEIMHLGVDVLVAA